MELFSKCFPECVNLCVSMCMEKNGVESVRTVLTGQRSAERKTTVNTSRRDVSLPFTILNKSQSVNNAFNLCCCLNLHQTCTCVCVTVGVCLFNS